MESETEVRVLHRAQDAAQRIMKDNELCLTQYPLIIDGKVVDSGEALRERQHNLRRLSALLNERLVGLAQ